MIPSNKREGLIRITITSASSIIFSISGRLVRRQRIKGTRDSPEDTLRRCKRGQEMLQTAMQIIALPYLGMDDFVLLLTITLQLVGDHALPMLMLASLHA